MVSKKVSPRRLKSNAECNPSETRVKPLQNPPSSSIHSFASAGWERGAFRTFHVVVLLIWCRRRRRGGCQLAASSRPSLAHNIYVLSKVLLRMKLYIGRRLKHSERGRGGRGLGGRGMVKLASRPLRPSMSEAVLSKISVPELTPRSALACKLHGVDPRELLPLSPDTFREFGERKEAEQLRYEAYEAARKETFELVRSERERILHGRPLEPTSPLRRSATERSSLCSNFTDSSLSTSSTHRFPEASMSMGRGVDVVRERRTLEKMRKRTTNSIELMLMNEIRMIKARDEEQVTFGHSRLEVLRGHSTIEH